MMTKKEKILDAALELFAKQGVAKTSTAQITKKARVAEGTLFVHFKNKQALVDSVYIEIKKKEAEAFSAVIQESKSVETNIRALTKVVVQHFLNNYQELLFIEHVTQLGIVSKKAMKESKSYFEAINAYIKKWQRQGKLKKLDSAAIGSMTWAMLVSVIHYCKQRNKKLTEKMVDPIWDALKT